MILDALLQLADAQALTAGTTVSTHKIDLGNVTPRRDIGAGEPLCVVVTIDVAAGTTGDTFDFSLVTDEDAALGSPTILLTRSFTFDGDTLPAGYMFTLPIPQGPREFERYLGLSVVVSTGGTVTYSAHVVPLSFVARLKAYRRGYTID